MAGHPHSSLLALALTLSACGGDTTPAATDDTAIAEDTLDSDADGVDASDEDAQGVDGDTAVADTVTPLAPPLLTGVPVQVAPGGEVLAVQPALAIGADGRVLVAWTGRSGEALGIHRALLDATGAVVAEATQVNTDTRGIQNEPSACALADGAYVIAWSVDTQETGPDGENLEVRFRRFGADGAALDPAGVRIQTAVPGNHWLAEVACDPAGGFVVAGVRPGDGPGFSVFFQRFDAEGAAFGGAVTALPSTTGGQAYPAVAVDATGAVIVAWEDTAETDADTTVVWRRFPATGEPSAVATIATAHGVDAAGAAVMADPSDGALALGANLGATTQLAWLADPAGSPVAVSLPGASPTSQITLAPLGDGRFGALWYAGTGSSVTARLGYFGADGFDADLTLATGAFPLAYRPALAYGHGVLAAAWTESLGSGAYAVRVALFAAAPE